MLISPPFAVALSLFIILSFLSLYLALYLYFKSDESLNSEIRKEKAFVVSTINVLIAIDPYSFTRHIEINEKCLRKKTKRPLMRPTSRLGRWTLEVRCRLILHEWVKYRLYETCKSFRKYMISIIAFQVFRTNVISFYR